MGNDRPDTSGLVHAAVLIHPVVPETQFRVLERQGRWQAVVVVVLVAAVIVVVVVVAVVVLENQREPETGQCRRGQNRPKHADEDVPLAGRGKHLPPSLIPMLLVAVVVRRRVLWSSSSSWVLGHPRDALLSPSRAAVLARHIVQLQNNVEAV